MAGDLSPTMLEETRRRCVEENIPVPELIRCDSAKLPFATNSISAIHSGAAIHCWPNLSQSLAEVYRVLKPGGVFYTTTFIFKAAMGGFLQNSYNSGFKQFKDIEEIQDYVEKAGFVNDGGVTVSRKEGRACVIVRATKAK